MQVKIEKLVFGGQALGTMEDGRKVFVWNALPDEEVEIEILKKKRNLICDAFKSIGLEDCRPKATLYIWQKIHGDSVDFAKRLLQKDTAIVTTPGNWLSTKNDGINPGEGYIRLALVPTIDECKEAAEKIRKLEI